MFPSKTHWMVFVDGENLSRRAQAVLRSEHSTEFLGDGDHAFCWMKDAVFWPTAQDPRSVTTYGGTYVDVSLRDTGIVLGGPAVRAHYYVTCGSGHGEDKRVEEKLVELGFTPYVDAVSKDDRDTYDRIDVQLASHFIGNAYRDNYEIAFLISGDGDYIPAVREVQRCGKIVFLAGFDHPKGGVSSDLKMVSDYFVDLCDCLLDLDES